MRSHDEIHSGIDPLCKWEKIDFTNLFFIPVDRWKGPVRINEGVAMSRKMFQC